MSAQLYIRPGVSCAGLEKWDLNLITVLYKRFFSFLHRCSLGESVAPVFNERSMLLS